MNIFVENKNKTDKIKSKTTIQTAPRRAETAGETGQTVSVLRGETGARGPELKILLPHAKA